MSEAVHAIAWLYGIEDLERTAGDKYSLASAGNLIKKNILQSKDIDLNKLRHLLGSVYTLGKDSNDSLFREFFKIPPENIPVMVGIFNLFEAQEALQEIESLGKLEDIVSELGDVCWAIAVLGSQFEIPFSEVHDCCVDLKPNIECAHLAAHMATEFMRGRFGLPQAKGAIKGPLVACLKGVQEFGRQQGVSLGDILTYNVKKLGVRYNVVN